MHRLSLLLGSSLLAACAVDPPTSTGSCAFGPPESTCSEYTDATDDQLEFDAHVRCDDHEGRWIDAPCSRARIIASCRAQIATSYGLYTHTTWFYASTMVATPDDVRTRCETLGTFVTP